jgi:hypothetical protein
MHRLWDSDMITVADDIEGFTLRELVVLDTTGNRAERH